MHDEFAYSQRSPALAAGEAILWRGKPKRGAFIAGKALTLMPFAVIWLILDLSVIGTAFSSGEMLFFLIPFFALHLMPVWLWLGSALTAGKRWRNTMYYVTNRRIVIQSGFLAVNEKSVFYKDIRNAQMQIGLIDKMCGTGSILLDDGYYHRNRRQSSGSKLEHLEDPQAAYERIQRTILDIQTDMEYPNAYRPEFNPGYNTDYRP